MNWPKYLLGPLIFLMSSTVYPSSIPYYPGILETLEKLSDAHQQEFKKLTSSVNKSDITFDSRENEKKYSYNKVFFRSILFQSPKGFIQLISNDQCSTISLLETNSIKVVTGLIKNIFITDKEKNQYLLKRRDYLSKVYKHQCFNTKDHKNLFQPQYLASTLKSISFIAPKDERQCVEIINGWKSNPFTPYICELSSKIKEGRYLKKISRTQKIKSFKTKREIQNKINEGRSIEKMLTFFQKNYINNLCQGLDSLVKFCRPYTESDAWKQILTGKIKKENLSYLCKKVSKKNKVTLSDLKTCASKVRSNNSICSTIGAYSGPALFPKPTCSSISDALITGRLNVDYDDCPGRIDNAGITNTYRILKHYFPKRFPNNAKECSTDPQQYFANMNLEFDNKAAWPLKICYDDKIKEKEVCNPYSPGEFSGPLSESLVVSQALKRMMAAEINSKKGCRVVSHLEYKPQLLQYQSGCFVTYDPFNCSTINCPKKIYYNAKEVKGITYKGKPLFQYFPISYTQSHYAISTIFEKKFSLKSKSLRNLTEIVYFLNKYSTNIIHGIGCIENIYPRLLSKKSFNQCHPIPFIIDGFTKKKNQTYLSLRTALDDIHSPQLINWNLIYSAVASYRSIHPISTWALYGLIKN